MRFTLTVLSVLPSISISYAASFTHFAEADNALVRRGLQSSSDVSAPVASLSAVHVNSAPMSSSASPALTTTKTVTVTASPSTVVIPATYCPRNASSVAMAGAYPTAVNNNNAGRGTVPTRRNFGRSIPRRNATSVSGSPNVTAWNTPGFRKPNMTHDDMISNAGIRV